MPTAIPEVDLGMECVICNLISSQLTLLDSTRLKNIEETEEGKANRDRRTSRTEKVYSNDEEHLENSNVNRRNCWCAFVALLVSMTPLSIALKLTPLVSLINKC